MTKRTLLALFATTLLLPACGSTESFAPTLASSSGRLISQSASYAGSNAPRPMASGTPAPVNYSPAYGSVAMPSAAELSPLKSLL